eukprot:763189-Hanusia_phi.AAC.2
MDDMTVRAEAMVAAMMARTSIYKFNSITFLSISSSFTSSSEGKAHPLSSPSSDPTCFLSISAACALGLWICWREVWHWNMVLTCSSSSSLMLLNTS